MCELLDLLLLKVYYNLSQNRSFNNTIMGKFSEIKCPGCGKWCNWTSRMDEKCPNCDAQLDPVRFQYEEEKRITAEMLQKNNYFLIKDTDDPVVQMFKQFTNWLRWTTLYGISVIYFVIVIMIILFGLAMI